MGGLLGTNGSIAAGVQRPTGMVARSKLNSCPPFLITPFWQRRDPFPCRTYTTSMSERCIMYSALQVPYSSFTNFWILLRLWELWEACVHSKMKGKFANCIGIILESTLSSLQTFISNWKWYIERVWHFLYIMYYLVLPTFVKITTYIQWYI